MKKLIPLLLAASFSAHAQDLAGAGALIHANFTLISQNMVEACPAHFAIKNKAEHDKDMKIAKKLQKDDMVMSASDAKESKAKMAKECDAVNKQAQEKNALKNITYKKPL